MSTNKSLLRTVASGRIGAVAVAVTMVVLAGCGSENVVKDGALAKDKGIPTLPTPTTLASAAGKPCKPATDLPKGKTKGKPTSVLMPKGKPPATLQSTDLKVGTGPAVKDGDTITVNYLGIACSTGKQFDSSWDSGTPFTATITAGGLINGWVKGVPGMKKGGRRELVVPAKLGYGADGNQGIAPNEALVFVIDLISIGVPPSTSTTAPGGSPGTTVPASTTAPAGAPSTSAAPTSTTGK